MRVVALEIPESPQEVAQWLTDHCCRGDMRSLVAQLLAVRESGSSQSPTLDEVIGRHREALLSVGLSSLPPKTIQTLLSNPSLLLDLQEFVMLEGGSYWRDQFSGPETEVSRATKKYLDEILFAQPETVSIPVPGRSRWYRSMVAAIAATLLAGFIGYSVFVRDGGEKIVATWGWDSTELTSPDVDAESYLMALANGANAWFNKRPDNIEALKTRLNEFEAGCEHLIAADHRPLAAPDRKWLIYKCRGWRTRLKQQQESLETGSFADSLRSADRLAQEIVDSLNERAANV